MAREIRIGDEVWVHGYVDEIRKDCIIIRNDGGYFGTVAEEIGYCDDYEDLTEEKHAICNGCVYCDLPNAFHPCASCVDFSKYVGEVSGDTPQTESTGSPIGDYRDGVGAWQTDCDDRYAIRTDSGEVVAYACPLGCEQTDCDRFVVTDDEGTKAYLCMGCPKTDCPWG